SPAPLHRGDVGGALDRARRGRHALRGRRHAHGRARRVRAALSRRLPEPGLPVGGARRRAPQVSRDPGPYRRRRCGRAAATRGASSAVSSVVMGNATIYLLDDALREGHGTRPALRTPTGEVSYAALLAVVERAAAGLRARGVGREDRVALLLPD